MIEILIHGRGGQGAVIASKIIALSFFYEGYEVQSFPSFGVERRGAPVSAFTRIDKKPIVLRSGIYNPDHVIVMDSHLLNTIDVTKGLKPGGSILVNSTGDQFKKMLKINCHAGSVDASSIALNHNLGSQIYPVISTAIAGAFAGFTGLVSIDSIEKAIVEEAPLKQEGNIAAARDAYEEVVKSYPSKRDTYKSVSKRSQ